MEVTDPKPQHGSGDRKENKRTEKYGHWCLTGVWGPLNSTAAIHLIRKFRNMVSPVGNQQHFTETIIF